MPLTTVNPGLLDTQAQYTGFKNRLINGQMVIDQRNNGASVTGNSAVYPVDRWGFNVSQTGKFTGQQNAGSITPPAGFTNYLGVTSSSAYSVLSGDFFGIGQSIEGFNTADLGFGAAGAQSVTVSFWVRSSLTGTFSFALTNNEYSRGYVTTYTVNASNTWEYKTVTIAGDTTGTWRTDNNAGIRLFFNLGAGSSQITTPNVWGSWVGWGVSGATSVVGTNGATFYITGVQLEKGSTATSFDYRPYGTELALCQRYFQRLSLSNLGLVDSFTNLQIAYFLPVTMRASPSVSYTNDEGTPDRVNRWSSSGYNANDTITSVSTNPNQIIAAKTSQSAGTILRMAATWSCSAEL